MLTSGKVLPLTSRLSILDLAWLAENGLASEMGEKGGIHSVIKTVASHFEALLWSL